MAEIKFLSFSGLTRLVERLKETFASITHTHTTEDITDYVKPIQTDWLQTDETQLDCIKNKPELTISDDGNGHAFIYFKTDTLTTSYDDTSASVSIPETEGMTTEYIEDSGTVSITSDNLVVNDNGKGLVILDM